MDELLHHCLRELAFDGDLGEYPLSCDDGAGKKIYIYIYTMVYDEEGSNPLHAFSP